MDFNLSEDHLAIRDAIKRICSKFPDEYWSHKDTAAEFPHEFHACHGAGRLARHHHARGTGRLGPRRAEAAVMMNAVAAAAAAPRPCPRCRSICLRRIPSWSSDACQRSACSRPLITGRRKTCFGVTEANAGLNTTQIKTAAKKVSGGYIVNGSKIWTSTAQEADNILLLTRTTPFEECDKADRRHDDFLHQIRSLQDRSSPYSRNWAGPRSIRTQSSFRICSYRMRTASERRAGISLSAAQLESGANHRSGGAIGIAQDALRRATAYAKERVVFGRAIGQNQAIQHPLAEKLVQDRGRVADDHEGGESVRSE